MGRVSGGVVGKNRMVEERVNREKGNDIDEWQQEIMTGKEKLAKQLHRKDR